MFFGVAEPTDDASWSYYLLYNLSLVRHCLLGVFYIPSMRYYGPVLDLDEKELEKIDSKILFEIPEDELTRALLIVCKKCGWCCEEEAGSFAFEHELRHIETFLGRKIRSLLRVRQVRLYNGKTIRVYLLEREGPGTCMFYDPSSKTCKIHPVKPIICRITYCARYAIDRAGRVYIRMGTRKSDGTVLFIPTEDEQARVSRQ